MADFRWLSHLRRGAHYGYPRPRTTMEATGGIEPHTTLLQRATRPSSLICRHDLILSPSRDGVKEFFHFRVIHDVRNEPRTEDAITDNPHNLTCGCVGLECITKCHRPCSVTLLNKGDIYVYSQKTKKCCGPSHSIHGHILLLEVF